MKQAVTVTLVVVCGLLCCPTAVVEAFTTVHQHEQHGMAFRRTISNGVSRRMQQQQQLLADASEPSTMDITAVTTTTIDDVVVTASNDVVTSATTSLDLVDTLSSNNMNSIIDNAIIDNTDIAVLMDATAAASSLDLDTVALVVGQENYGFAIVALGEAFWSFLQAPSVDHGLKTLLPAGVAALILIFVSGPMVTLSSSSSGSIDSIALGLEIATLVSVLLGGSYLARLLAPYSPSAKEIAFLGLLVSIAAFFSFAQNLLVDGFVTLPSLPHIPMPSLSLPF